MCGSGNGGEDSAETARRKWWWSVVVVWSGLVCLPAALAIERVSERGGGDGGGSRPAARVRRPRRGSGGMALGYGGAAQRTWTDR